MGDTIQQTKNCEAGHNQPLVFLSFLYLRLGQTPVDIAREFTDTQGTPLKYCWRAMTGIVGGGELHRSSKSCDLEYVINFGR